MFQKIKALAIDSATYGITTVLSQVISFFLLPLYTSYLTPRDYGHLAMLSIIAMLYVALANLGITNAIFRRFNTVKSEEERKEVLSTGLIGLLAIATMLLLAGIIFAGPISSILIGDYSYVNLVSLILTSAFLDTVAQIPMVILRADRRVKVVASMDLVNIFISISLSILFVAVFRWGIEGFISANLVGSFFNVIFLFIFVRKRLEFKFRFYIWRKMLQYGLPFLPHRLMTMALTQFGIYMISHAIGANEAGIYSVATRIVMPLALVVNAVQQAWVPYKFQIHAHEENPSQVFRSLVTYYIATTVYLWVGVSLWGPEVVRLMTNQKFHDAAWLIPFVGLIPLLQGFYFMFGTGIELSDNTTPMPFVSLAGLVAVVLSSFLLIPLIDSYGAALATVVGWITMTTAIYFVSQIYFKINYDWKTITLIILLAIGSVTIGTVNQQAPLVIRLLIAVSLSSCYPIIAYFIILRSSSERDRMQSVQLKLQQKIRVALGL